MSNSESKDSQSGTMPLTRRGWAAMVVAVPLVAQVTFTPQKLAAPTTAAASSEPSAIDDVRKVSEKLSQIEMPMSVEPAFAFRAL